jgi:DNA-binding PadR family transcriptional regulator
LPVHIKALEESGYIKVQKGFIGRKTNTTYSATKAGEKAFKVHLDALEQMIKNMGKIFLATYFEIQSTFKIRTIRSSQPAVRISCSLLYN